MKTIIFSVTFVITLGVVMAIADVPEEARVCAACHSFEKGGAKKVGPNLWGIYEKESSVAGGGWKWTEEKLDRWLEDPASAVKEFTKKNDAKTTMTMKIPDKGKRKKIIEYLKTLK